MLPCHRFPRSGAHALAIVQRSPLPELMSINMFEYNWNIIISRIFEKFDGLLNEDEDACNNRCEKHFNFTVFAR